MKGSELLSSCSLCPRDCGCDRRAGKKGYCRSSGEVNVARAALHMWEEPCISGEKGSGAVFFCGCSLGCIYCQNREISGGERGIPVSVKRLAEIFLELQEKGAANLNLVTGSHYVPQIREALLLAKEEGFFLPVVFNCGGYEKQETLRLLEGLVDVYLPDFKYMEAALAKQLSKAEDYPETALSAVREMLRQTGECVFDKEGYLIKGTLVRHLILPGHTVNSRKVLSVLHENFGDRIFISIMNQYTPCRTLPFPELNRRVTRREYEKVLAFATEELGITRGFFQEGETARESFIPAFDHEGVLPAVQAE